MKVENDKEHKSKPGWDDIFHSAIQSDDAHIIKLIFTCHEEEKEYNDPQYRYVAEREINSFT